jgi:hypothetical protein
MSVADTSASGSMAIPRKSLDPPHVHTWELRAVEFDAWGQVTFYECLGCTQVRYV